MAPEENPGMTRGATKDLDPVGSAVLTFIGYKRTEKQTSKIYT